MLERALPVYRVTSAPVELPDMDQADNLTEKANAVLRAVADGQVPPDVGAQLVSAIGSIARVTEIDELTRRIEQLEKSHAKS